MAEESSDGRVLQWLRDILRAGVCDGESWQLTLTGVRCLTDTSRVLHHSCSL